MMEQKDVRINIRNYQRELNDILIHPMKIYVSVQNGRQYLLAWDYFNERPFFYRFVTRSLSSVDIPLCA